MEALGRGLGAGVRYASRGIWQLLVDTQSLRDALPSRLLYCRHWYALRHPECDGTATHRAISTFKVAISSERNSYKPCISLQQGWSAKFRWESNPTAPLTAEKRFVAPPGAIKLHEPAGASGANSADGDGASLGSGRRGNAADKDRANGAPRPRADDESHDFFPLLLCTDPAAKRQQGRNRQKRQSTTDLASGGGGGGGPQGLFGASKKEMLHCHMLHHTFLERHGLVASSPQHERTEREAVPVPERLCLIHPGEVPQHLTATLRTLETRLMFSKVDWARRTRSGPWQNDRGWLVNWQDEVGDRAWRQHLVANISPHWFTPCLVLRNAASDAALFEAAAAAAEKAATTGGLRLRSATLGVTVEAAHGQARLRRRRSA